MNNTPDEECPRFDVCSVNKCPLSPDYAKLYTCEGDPETRCLARRSTREEIASRCDSLILPNRGLLDKEKAQDLRRMQAKARWEALSDEEKAKRIGKLRELRAKGVAEGKVAPSKTPSKT